MLLYIGCHSASTPSPIGWRLSYWFLSRLSLSLCVCSGGQWHSSKWAPVVCPPHPSSSSACIAVDCDIEPAEHSVMKLHKHRLKEKQRLREGISNKQATREKGSWGGRRVDWNKAQPRTRWWGDLTTHSENQRRERVNRIGRLGVRCTEVVMKQSCLEFIWSCHAVLGPLSVISLCRD